METFDSKIATLAATLVQQQLGEKHEKAYRSLCESFPFMIYHSGLQKTIAFLKHKAKTAGEYKALDGHLEKQFDMLGFPSMKSNMTSRQLRINTTFAARIALWHKRIAQAVIEKEKEKEEQS